MRRHDVALPAETLRGNIQRGRHGYNLTAGNYSTEKEFREAIKLTRKLTDKPLMVNVTNSASVHITAEHHKMYLRVCVEEKVVGLEISGTPLDRVVGREYADVLKKRESSFSNGTSCRACGKGRL